MPSVSQFLESNVTSVVRKSFLAEIDRWIEQEIFLMNEVSDHALKFSGLCQSKDHLEIFDEQLAKYKQTLHKLIKDKWIEFESLRFTEKFPEISNEIDRIVQSIPEYHIREQQAERFRPLPGDSVKIRFLKRLKSLLFPFTRFHIWLLNPFRKLFGKPPYKVHYWKRKIPLRRLAAYHFKYGLLEPLLLCEIEVIQILCSSYLKLKSWEDQLNKDGDDKLLGPLSKDIPHEIFKDIEKSINKIKTDIKNQIRKNATKWNEDYLLTGTVELPLRNFRENRLNDLFRKADSEWEKRTHEWKNTLFALFEEWRTDIEIYFLSYSVLAELKKFKSLQEEKLKESIDPNLEGIEEIVGSARKEIEESKELKSTLLKVKYRVAKKLDQEILPTLSEKLVNKNLSGLISRLEASIREDVEKLSDKRLVVKTNEYAGPLRDGELHRVSPYELISFEILEEFTDNLQKGKNILFNTLEDINKRVDDIDRIVVFSLNSVINALEQGEEMEDARSIALEGLDRALNRVADVRTELENSLTSINSLIEEAVQIFIKKILDFTDNENVLEIRLRISKAKALRQSSELRARFLTRLRASSRDFFSHSKKRWDNLQKRITRFRQRYFLTSAKRSISKEVADFLTESQQSIDQLPLVYKRLYRIEPLEEMELFVGREIEYERFKFAFSTWEKKRFAATAIVGEKLGGLTSFLNFSLARIDIHYPVKRFNLKENIWRKDQILEFIRSLTNQQIINDTDHAVEVLNDGPQQVIILEDIQNMYLRKVGGFEALKILFQLILRTNHHIFWVVTIPSFTWDYLIKTTKIDDFFSYVIYLETFTEEQIVRIITERNRISGYRIKFEADDDIKDHRKYRRLNSEEKQQYLRDHFFSNLNDYAKSNVSLALIFWLLSTKRVDQNAITIGTFDNPDLSFVHILSDEKIFTLHALILHDGLSEQQLSEVTHQSADSCRMTLLMLLEDGVVIYHESGEYTVNPLIFRNVVNLLKDKNLIY